MHFDVEHTIRIPFDSYFDIVLSDDFNAWVKKRLKQDVREVVRNEERDGVIYRTVRSERILSARAQKFLKVPVLIIEEQQEIRRAAGSYTWAYVPNAGKKRFASSGTGRIEPAGDYLKRHVSGEVTVRIPLIGKRIEKRMVEGIRNNITRVGDALEDYYRKQQAKS